MTPTIIGTQQQLRSLWHTNTSLTPCHQGAFLHTGFPRDSNPQAHPKEFPEQYCAALYKERRQPIVGCLKCHVCHDPMDHSHRDKQQLQQ